MTKNNNETLLAFVNDKKTLEVIKDFDLKKYGLSLEINQANVTSAISYLQANRSPKILLVDISGSELPITDMKSLAEVCEPGVQVVALGDRNDVGIFRDLVDIGVRDYIAKPLNEALIAKCLDNLLGKKEASQKSTTAFSQQGKLVSFVGARGGVGSSVLASNVAYALGHGYFKRVCLMDLDFRHGIVSQLYNVENLSSLREILETPDRIDESLLAQSTSKFSDYLSILSSSVPLDDQFQFPKEALEKLAPLLSKLYHYSVFDFPRYDHQNHYPIISNSGIIVIVFDFTLLSVRDLVSMLRIMRINDKARLILVANRQGEYKKGELSEKMFEDSLQREIDLVIPFDSTKPLQTINEGIPVASEKGVLSDGVYGLAKLIAGKEAQEAPSNNGLFSGLFGKKAAANN